MPKILEIAFDTDRLKAGDRRVFCELDNDLVLACDGEKALAYATVVDGDEVVAFQRYLDAKPDEFFKIDARPGAADFLIGDGLAPEIGEGTSYTAELTPMDRARMRNVVRKHHRFYFAEQPTTAQIDQLIDAIGPIAAQKCVRKALDAGKVQ